MQTIKDILDLIRQVVKAMTNVAVEAEAWTEELVAESKMARTELSADREARLKEIQNSARKRKKAKSKA